MADENEGIYVKFGAKTNELEAGMKQAADVVKGGVEGMKEGVKGLTEAFESILAPLKLFAGVLAGGAFLKEAIGTTIAFTGEVVSLTKKLGITTEEAVKFNVALKLIGVSTGDYISAASKLDKQLKSNENGLVAMGVQVRTSTGEFKSQQEIMKSAFATMLQYKEGTDRNMAAQELFGRSADEVTKMMKLNGSVMEQAEKLTKAYNLEVTGAGIQAAKDYKMSLAAMSIAFEAISDAVGKVFLPIINRVGAWFRDEGPEYVGAFINVIEQLGDVVKIVADTIVDFGKITGGTFTYIKDTTVASIGEARREFTLWQIAMQTIKVMCLELRFVFVTIFEQMSTVVKVFMSDLLRLKEAFIAFENSSIFDMTAVGAAWERGAKRAADLVDQEAKKLAKLKEETEAEIKRILSGEKETTKVEETKAPPKGTKSFKAYKEPDKDKDTRMAGWEADLLKMKQEVLIKTQGVNEMTLEEEANYWETLAHAIGKGDEKYTAVLKKQQQAKLEDLKKKAADGKALSEEEIAFQEKTALNALDMQKENSSQLLALGLQTQEQMLAKEKEFEDKKYAINEKALKERLKLAEKDPNRNVVEHKKLLDAIADLEQKHILEVSKIENKSTQESVKNIKSMIDSVSSAVSASIKGLLNGTMTIVGAIKSLAVSVAGAMIDMLSQIAAKQVATYLSEMIFGKANAMAQIGANAAAAGSAAFASTAAIPIIGPELAPAAGAAAYSGAMSFASLLPSFDIGAWELPKDMNARVHQGEMIIPKPFADDLRQNGGNIGSGVNVTIHAIDAAGVKKLFMDHGSELIESIKNQNRNFATR